MRNTASTRVARHRAVLALGVVALVATGCSSSRFGGGDLYAGSPQPLPAAPSGQVTTQSLAAPSVTASGPGNVQPLPGADPNATDPNAAAADPNGQGVQTAALDPNAASATPAAPAAGGQPITENALIGNWTTSVNGASCATFFGLTDLGSGLRGGTRGCQGDLSKFRTWKVAGNSATLRDSTGGTVATLTRTGDKSFSGTTAGGQSFTLTR